MDPCIRRALAALAVLALAAAPAAATEHTLYEAVPIEPAAPAATIRHTEDCPRLGLLDIPPGWQAGQPVALVLRVVDDPMAAGEEPGWTARLLDHGLAVLEHALDPGCSAAATRQGRAADALGETLGALAALAERTSGAPSLVVGIGAAGPVALAAAERSLQVAGSAPGLIAGVAPAAAAVGAGGRLAAVDPAWLCRVLGDVAGCGAVVAGR